MSLPPPPRNADALYTITDAEGVDETFFVEPHNDKLPMKTFIDRLLGTSGACLPCERSILTPCLFASRIG